MKDLLQELQEIKRIIRGNKFNSIELEVGTLGNKIKYSKSFNFGNRVLAWSVEGYRYDFKGVKNGVIQFREYKPSKQLSESEQRGYGLGTYTAD